MCGRYTLTVTLEELIVRFMIEDAFIPFHRPKYNVAPGQMVPAVISDGKRNRLGELKWGLIPPWADDPGIGSRMINARAETAADKPAFREALRRKRCLIPADGFYEWRKDGQGKQPMRIVMKDRSLFAMAGLYETWLAPDGRKISTCTVLTTAPNALMADIHDRMPVILRPEDEAVWLDRANREPQRLRALLKPYPEELMEAYPVSAEVGNVRNDSPRCIEPVGSVG
ncbi:SOS response-associated peptidase [Paenibacillus cisolokensis]|jgi:putative SOS response-associated peptidase YedK|uniref:Abasic site processing protein n=1 Tax=Paenibacillus cisolokensis TaxID=1658519 RepID=A0ABQ4NBP9_9BACL|nr:MULTISPECIES: SOS response-associated peptidase [Paenibacillus]ALS27490.1 SOS response associated peptidase [Paenibacillus sp. 32O-W]GIQ65648.1 putative SOS response-associated peptidase YoqW [Paenibacillus cisolokensis]